MQAVSASDLRTVDRETGSNCRNHFNSFSLVSSGCFSSSPGHAYTHLRALSLLCIMTSSLFFKDLGAFSECF